MDKQKVYEQLIFELSKEGRTAFFLPDCDVPNNDIDNNIPTKFLRDKSPNLPQVSEIDVSRHYTRLSTRNHGVDSGFYPLGSCTMKYNPKVNEEIAKFNGFARVHPYQPNTEVQGCLQVLYEMDIMLSEITGMDKFTLQPAAGAHGEMAGLMIIKAYHDNRGDAKRNKIIVPDTAHGTNPASAAMAGFDVVEVKSDSDGNVDVAMLRTLADESTAGLMLTNPNTLGLFEKNIVEIAKIIHDAGGLLYYDGANTNAIMGITRPGDMGFDVVHINLHKTFSTPHGGGGPGAGPVGVKKHLEAFLPVPVITKNDNVYAFDYDRPLSIGKVRSFYGNFGVILKAYSYILSMGGTGLREVSEMAVTNANYLMYKLRDTYELPYNRKCMHEFVLSGQKQKSAGVSTLEMAKRLLDFGVHPPTIYFPLIVKEAMMIEPTETESVETLDEFVDIMNTIAREVETSPEVIKTAPHNTPVGRLDEAKAARMPVVRWKVR